MRPGLLGTFKEFAARYCAPTINPFRGFVEYNGKAKLPEFNAILEVRRALPVPSDVQHDVVNHCA